ncbi:MFS transporter, partial [Acinetobacter baumannii]
RALQGIAAALAMAGGAASLAHEFDGEARTRAYGLLGTSFGVGLALGPVWAGFLIETFGWRSVFLTGVAIGVLVLAFGVPRMSE